MISSSRNIGLYYIIMELPVYPKDLTDILKCLDTSGPLNWNISKSAVEIRLELVWSKFPQKNQRSTTDPPVDGATTRRKQGKKKSPSCLRRDRRRLNAFKHRKKVERQQRGTTQGNIEPKKTPGELYPPIPFPWPHDHDEPIDLSVLPQVVNIITDPPPHPIPKTVTAVPVDAEVPGDYVTFTVYPNSTVWDMQNIIFNKLVKIMPIPTEHPSDIVLLQYTDDDTPLPTNLRTHEFFDPELKEEHIFFDFMYPDSDCSSCDWISDDDDED